MGILDPILQDDVVAALKESKIEINEAPFLYMEDSEKGDTKSSQIRPFCIETSGDKGVPRFQKHTQTYIPACIHIHIHIHIHIQRYMHTQIRIHIGIHIYVRTHTHTRTHTGRYTYIDIHTKIDIHRYTYVDIHTYTYIYQT